MNIKGLSSVLIETIKIFLPGFKNSFCKVNEINNATNKFYDLTIDCFQR